MFRLFVNKRGVEGLNSDTVIINRPIFDLTNLSIRAVSASNNLILPRTGKNVETFNLLNQQKIGEIFLAELYYKTALILKGNVILKDISENTIKLQLVDKGKEFFENLKRPLSSLDLTESDFFFSRAEFNNLKIPTNPTIWYWPAVNNTDELSDAILSYFDQRPGSSTHGQTDLAYARPCYKILDLLKEIIEQNGFNADLSDLSEIDDIVLTSNSDKFLFSDFERRFQNINLPANTGLNLNLGTVIKDPENFYIISGANNDFISSQFAITRYAISGTIKATQSLQLTVGEEVFFINTGKIDIITQESDPGFSVNFQFDEDVEIIDLRITGLIDEVQYYIQGDVTPWPNGDIKLNGWRRDVDGTVDGEVPLLEGYLIKASYNMPEWTQFEFLQELWSLFYLDFNFIDDTIKVTFNNQIRKRNALNFDKSITVPKFEEKQIFSQANVFKFTNDDKMSEFFGSKKILFDDPLLSAEDNNFIEVKSSASLDRYFAMGVSPFYKIKTARQNIYAVSFKVGEDLANQNEEDRTVRTPRFLRTTSDDYSGDLLEEINRVGYFQYSEPRIIAPITRNPIRMDFDYLYNLYYAPILNNLTGNLSIKISKMMTYLEYIEISEKRVYYYEEIKSYALVISISKFNPNFPTELELVSF